VTGAKRAVLAIVLAVCGGAHAATSSISDFFSSQGFSEDRLQRRFGNQLFFDASVNGRRAALMIDTSEPSTVIHRESAGTFGLLVAETGQRVRGAFGEQGGTLGRSRIAALRIGNQTFSDVPVLVENQAARIDPPEFLPIAKLKWNAKRKKLSHYTRIESVDGLLGLDLLRRTGAVLDCGHQRLFTSNSGPNAGASQRLAAFLADHGFARIAMRRTGGSQVEVPATINGRSTHLLVDTGSSFTILNIQTAVASAVFSAPERLAYDIGGNRFERLSRGTVRQLVIGGFELNNADVNLAEIPNPALLGIDQLSMNYAVIDFANMTLYLRHPDRR
jgi:predicted aspartyl protease